MEASGAVMVAQWQPGVMSASYSKAFDAWGILLSSMHRFGAPVGTSNTFRSSARGKEVPDGLSRLEQES